jgi:hypothetical protein
MTTKATLHQIIEELPGVASYGAAWERHAPAWLLEPGRSPAVPGKATGAGHTK